MRAELPLTPWSPHLQEHCSKFSNRCYLYKQTAYLQFKQVHKTLNYILWHKNFITYTVQYYLKLQWIWASAITFAVKNATSGVMHYISQNVQYETLHTAQSTITHIHSISLKCPFPVWRKIQKHCQCWLIIFHSWVMHFIRHITQNFGLKCIKTIFITWLSGKIASCLGPEYLFWI